MTDKEVDKDLQADEQVIDPRLDNRVGNQRPKLETFPAKPQQIDGPDVAHNPTAKQAAAIAKDQREGNVGDNDPRKGAGSPGPHGLGDTEAVPFEEAVGRKTGPNAESADNEDKDSEKKESGSNEGETKGLTTKNTPVKKDQS